MRKIFVTGIGTDVGKTTASAILVEGMQADYWKPVQAGNYFDTDSNKIKKWISNSKSVIHPEAYSLKNHMSPHAAAETEGITIEIDKINLPVTTNTLIIEGAGGLMVPLNHKDCMIDLIKKFEAEVIIVIQNYLGSINHSLLTIDALKHRNIPILGIIFNGVRHQLSEDIILEYEKLKCIGKINKETQINKDIILKYAPQFRSI
jgi:dethiobiotin synthetase